MKDYRYEIDNINKILNLFFVYQANHKILLLLKLNTGCFRKIKNKIKEDKMDNIKVIWNIELHKLPEEII